MTNPYCFAPLATPSLPIAGTPHQRFPVRRIFCVGRNYAEHTREMGGDPREQPPIFFTKPADSLVESGAVLPYPSMTQNLHHEAELVIAIGTDGMNVDPSQAESLIWGYGAGNDLTRRDLQANAKKNGQPWDMAKGFDQSAIMGALRPGPLALKGRMIRSFVDDALRQEASLEEMIWSCPEIIARLSQMVTLRAGDLIFTGTPSGVGPVISGQSCRVTIDGLEDAVFTYL